MNNDAVSPKYRVTQEQATMRFLNTVPYTTLFVGALILFSVGILLGRFSSSNVEKRIVVEHRPLAMQEALLASRQACESATTRPQTAQLTIASVAAGDQ